MREQDKQIINEFKLFCHRSNMDATTELLRLMKKYVNQFRDPVTGVFDPHPALYVIHTSDGKEDKVPCTYLYDCKVYGQPRKAIYRNELFYRVPPETVILLDESTSEKGEML